MTRIPSFLVRILSTPLNWVGDRILGPADKYEYTGTTTPDDTPFEKFKTVERSDSI
jgi:hypothetical protein